MDCTLHLENSYHRPLPQVPLTYGVPIPEGLAKSVANLVLLSPAGAPAPAAIQPMATWRDGSIRWALLDFQVDYERQLIDSGWRLVEFSPERRRRRDRRKMPRFGEERRRRPSPQR